MFGKSLRSMVRGCVEKAKEEKPSTPKGQDMKKSTIKKLTEAPVAQHRIELAKKPVQSKVAEHKMPAIKTNSIRNASTAFLPIPSPNGPRKIRFVSKEQQEKVSPSPRRLRDAEIRSSSPFSLSARRLNTNASILKEASQPNSTKQKPRISFGSNQKSKALTIILKKKQPVDWLQITDAQTDLSPLYDSKYEEFEIKHVLGKGAYATTYLAVHSTTKIGVALKIYTYGDKHILREDILSEVSILRRVQHACIVKIFSCFEKVNKSILVLE